MHLRTVIIGLTSVIATASLWAVLVQSHTLAHLRAERQQWSQIDSNRKEPAEPPPSPAPASPVISSELLRLRSQVTQLSARQRELAGVQAENDRLRAELAPARTNGAAGVQLPPGYVRKADARLVGYASPTATLQSFLYALHHRDLTNLLQAVTPAQALQLQNRVQSSPQELERFFGNAEMIPGLAVVGQLPQTDGSMEVEVEFVPGVTPTKLRLVPVEGTWRLTDAP